MQLMASIDGQLMHVSCFSVRGHMEKKTPFRGHKRTAMHGLLPGWTVAIPNHGHTHGAIMGLLPATAIWELRWPMERHVSKSQPSPTWNMFLIEHEIHRTSPSSNIHENTPSTTCPSPGIYMKTMSNSWTFIMDFIQTLSVAPPMLALLEPEQHCRGRCLVSLS